MTVYAPELLKDARHHAARAYGECQDWLAHLEVEGKAPRTTDDYERSVAALLRDRLDTAPTDFTSADLTHFLRAHTQGRRRIVYAHLNSFFGYLYRQALIDQNPMDRVPRPRTAGRTVVDCFTDTELELLYRTDPLAILLGETGMRKSEARMLRVSHVSMERRKVVPARGPIVIDPELRRALFSIGVSPAELAALSAAREESEEMTWGEITLLGSRQGGGAKGDKSRRIPMTQRAYDAVRQLIVLEGLNTTDYFWGSRPGGGDVVEHSRPVGNGTWHRWWADPKTGLLARAGVPYRNPHTMRHTFATRLLRAGARIENVQKLMGHASIQTTIDEYGHLTVDDARADLALLEV